MNNNPHSVSSFFDNLFGIEAIDKFVAKAFGFIDELAQEERFIWAGVLAYLSYMQRNGHSCIYLKEVAGTTLFKETDTEEAAGLSAPAPLTAEVLGETANIVKVGGKRRIHRHRRHRHRHFRRGHHWGWGYRPAYYDCFYKVKKRWSPRRGRFIFKKVRICY